MPIVDLERLVSGLVLASARAVPVGWAIPALGGTSLPTMIRISFGVGLSLFCLPLVNAQHVDGLWWILLCGREILVGVTLAFVCGCAFRAIESAGRLMDISRGASLSAAPSALSAEPSPPIALLMLLLAALAFFQIGGPAHLAWALQRSYEAVPITGNATGLDTHGAAVMAIVSSAKLFESALAIAAPMLVAALLADLVLGIVARAVPQQGIAEAAAPLKSLVVIVMLLVGLGAMQAGLQGTLRAMLTSLGTVWSR